MTLNLRATANGCTLAVRVHPGARRNAITGISRWRAQNLSHHPTHRRPRQRRPHRLLSRSPQHSPRQHQLITGATTRTKTLHLEGLTPEALTATLLPGPS